MSTKAPKNKKPTVVYYIEIIDDGDMYIHGPFCNKPNKLVLKRYFAKEKDIVEYKLVKIVKENEK
jgi:hypothetical protein